MKSGKLLKYIITGLFLTFAANSVFAQSYIMISPVDIVSVDCKNNKVLSFNILSTLNNEKRSLIVTSLSDGNAEFTVKLKTKKCGYKANVHNGKLGISGDKTLKLLPVDLPPELNIVEESK